MISRISNWWKDKKHQEDLDNAEFWRKHSVKKEEAQKKADELSAVFNTKPCPFNDFNNCRKDCIHFRKGYIIDFTESFPYDGICISVIEPRCKLWGKK